MDSASQKSVVVNTSFENLISGFFFFLIPTLVKLSTKQLLDCVQAVPYCFYIIVSFYWYSSTVSVYIYVYTDNTIYIVYILVTVGD